MQKDVDNIIFDVYVFEKNFDDESVSSVKKNNFIAHEMDTLRCQLILYLWSRKKNYIHHSKIEVTVSFFIDADNGASAH